MISAFGILRQIIIIFVLIGINAFFAASEIAIISFNKAKLEKLAEEGVKKAQLLLNFSKEPSTFLATIQVGITLAGFLASASASGSFSSIIASWITGTGIPLAPGFVNAVSVIIVVGILTFITLVIGELVPKRLALQKYERISMSVAAPLNLLLKAGYPFVKLLTISTNLLIRAFGGNPDDYDQKVSEEEIMMMIDVGEEKGLIGKNEKQMIENVFEFDDTSVSKIMTSRINMVSISESAGLDDIINIVEQERFSRIPVYSGNIDNIIGILHAKDLIGILKNPDQKKGFDLKKIVRPPYFVHISKKTDELFKELKQQKNHIAIVIDDFGGTAGLVTMEDLIEEIVGNIFDEDDEVVRDVEKIDDNTFMINGSIWLHELAEFFDIKLPVEEYETLSGFLIGQIGKIPEEGERLTVEYEGMLFKIEKVENKTIARVKACKI